MFSPHSLMVGVCLLCSCACYPSPCVSLVLSSLWLLVCLQFCDSRSFSLDFPFACLFAFVVRRGVICILDNVWLTKYSENHIILFDIPLSAGWMRNSLLMLNIRLHSEGQTLTPLLFECLPVTCTLKKEKKTHKKKTL